MTGLDIASGGTYTVDQGGWQLFAATRATGALGLPSEYQGSASVLFFRGGMKSGATVGSADRYGALSLSGKYLGIAQASDMSGNELLALEDTGGNDWTPSLPNPWGANQFSASGGTLAFAYPDAQAYTLSAAGLLKDSASSDGLRVQIGVYPSGNTTTYQIPVPPGLNYALEDPDTRTVDFTLNAFRGDPAKAEVLFGGGTPTESALAGLDVTWVQRSGGFNGSSYTLP